MNLKNYNKFKIKKIRISQTKLDKIKSIKLTTIIFILFLFTFPYTSIVINAFFKEINEESVSEVDKSNMRTNSVSYSIFATRIGLVGQTTANGHIIQPNDRFVALPSSKVLCSNGGYEFQVRISYNSKSVIAPVWDIGPWNIQDDYWNPSQQREMWNDLPQGTPEAQAAYQNGYNSGKDQYGRTVSNPAGIDLADGTFWSDLGMTDNDWVTVEFLWVPSVSVRDSFPYFTKGSNSGHPEYWNTYIHDGYEYLWTYIGGMATNPSQTDCWAEFRPYFPQAGRYEVYSCFYADPENSDRVPHTIYYDGGTTTVNVNQYASNYFTWTRYKLGTWDFAAGASSRIIITDANGDTYDGTTLNADTIEFVLVSQPSNNKPNAPTLVGQYFSDGTTPIPEGGTTNEHIVVFKAFVSDPDGDDVTLEIELRNINEPFYGVPTGETISNPYPSGSEVSVTRYGLDPNGYKWQYRAKDSEGEVSDWVEFGSPGNTDFTVYIPANNPPLVPFNLYQLTSDEITIIPEGGTTNEDTVVFKAAAVDPDNDNVMLEIELRQFNEPFIGTPTPETISDYYLSGYTIRVPRSWLVNADYHWQCRVRDSKDAVSEWVEFGGSGNIDFTVSVPVNNPPNIPTSLSQLKFDLITAIPEGGVIGESPVTFKGIVNDPDWDDVRLEIELRQMHEPFIGQPTYETISHFAPSWSELSVIRYGLVPGDYHWQYRAMDLRGAYSEWSEFGVTGNVDFTIVEIGPPSLSNGYVTPTSGEILTLFNFYVTYYGAAPLSSLVYVDDVPFFMEMISGDYISGAIFQSTTNLGPGDHNFYFEFQDNNGNTINLPSSGYYQGPTVLSESPISYEWDRSWGEQEIKSGNAFTLDSFNNIYYVGSNQLTDISLIKFNSQGIEQWSTSWGGNELDYGRAVIIDSLQNIYVAGDTESYGYGQLYTPDICVIKFNQFGEVIWSRIWGGESHDYCTALAVDSDDNIYVAGQTRSFGGGGYDMFLLKYNSLGILQWQRIWGGQHWEDCYGMKIDSSNNILLVGYTESYGTGAWDICLVKFDINGNELWYRTWGEHEAEYGCDIAFDSSNNIFITGVTHSVISGEFYSEMVLIKYNSLGIEQWYKTWSVSQATEGLGIALDSLNNIYITGMTGGATGSPSAFLIKYNSLGIEQWYKIKSGITLWQVGVKIAIDSLDNIYISGNSHSPSLLFIYNPGYENYLLKYDKTGSLIWEFKWGGTSNDFGIDSAVDSENNVYVAGLTESYGTGGFDTCLLKYDSSGNLIWSRTWGTSKTEGCYGIAIDSLDNIYITGYTYDDDDSNYDMILLKYDKFGNLIWSKIWGGSGMEGDTFGMAVSVDSFDNIIVTGVISDQLFFYSPIDAFILKYNSNGLIQWEKTFQRAQMTIPMSLSLDTSNNIYITGMTAVDPYYGGPDIFVAKFDNFGVELWYNEWGSENIYDYSYSIDIDSLNNVYIAGSTQIQTEHNTGNMLLIKYDQLGTQQWIRTWGGIGNEICFTMKIDQYDDIYLAGPTDSFSPSATETCIVKYDASGNYKYCQLWSKGSFNYYYSINIDSFSNIYLAGYTSDPLFSDYDISLVKFSQETYEPRSSSLFDGMFLDFTASGSFIDFDTARVSYSQLSENIFQATITSADYYAWYDVNKQTRIISNSGGNLYFMEGTHSIYWIFTDAQLGDYVPILVDGEGDHLFRIHGDRTYYLPGFGTVEVWELEDLDAPGAYVWYEKSTGILMKGFFYYNNGNDHYEVELVDSNSDFEILNQAPNNPSNLLQLESDGITIVPEGGDTYDTTIVFKGLVSDNDGDNVRLEIELREFNQDFTGEPLLFSQYVPSGSEAIIIRQELLDGNYHWQYRARDSNGDISNWIEFQESGNIDLNIKKSYVRFDLSEGWQYNQLFTPTIRRSSEDPKKLEIGVYNNRDMWYILRFYKSVEGGQWIEFDPVEGRSWYFLHPYGGFHFDYTPEAGEELKIEVINDLNDEKLTALWSFDFLMRVIFGFSVSPEISSPAEAFTKLFTLFDDFAKLGGYLATKQYKSAGIHFINMLITSEKLRNAFISLIYLFTGRVITSSEILAKILPFAPVFTVLMHSGLWSSLIANTDLIPFIEDVILKTELIGEYESPNILLTESLEIYEEPFHIGKILNARFTVKNIGSNTIILKSLTVGGRGPDNSIRDFSFKTDITINPGESYTYLGQFVPLESGFYHFFVAYETYNHEWVTSLPTEDGVIKIIDIFIDPIPDEWKGAIVGSPVEIRVVDSQGRRLGSFEGQIFNEIPNSYYYEDLLIIFFPDEEYTLYYELEGLSMGTYNLTIFNSTKADILNFTATNIPTISESIHHYEIDWDFLSQGEVSVNVDIDSDGDGTIDHSFTSNNELYTAEYVVGTMMWTNEGDALQDGFVFDLETLDNTLINWITVSIREPGGEDGIIISDEFENIPLIYDDERNIWESNNFDTTQLPDGYYVLFIQICDASEFTSTITFDFSIRNWAVLELLPSTERNRAGRTMPVKFSLRVVEAVDPEMPFVWNEELEIIIYDKNNPDIILQYSIFGDTSVDYRISSEDELYITNFKTLKTEATYVVEIWRKGMRIGLFEFETYKSKIKIGASVSSTFENFQILLQLNSIFLLLGMTYLLTISRKKLIHL